MLIAVLGVLTALSVCGCSPKFSEFVFMQMSDPQIGFRDKTQGYVHSDSLFARAVWEIGYHKFRYAIMSHYDPRRKNHFWGPECVIPQLVIITGDLVNDQRDALQDSIYMANRAKIDVPVYEIPGNHDIRPWTPENHSNYLALRGYDRFSFRYRGCSFIGIDSNCIVDSSEEDRGGDVKISPSDKAAAAQAEAEQLEWLKKELRNARRCHYTFVFMHCPVILKDIDEENNYFNFPKKKRAEYIALFKEYGVDVVFAGHTHMDYDTTAEGIRFVTAGPVGSPLGRGYSGHEYIRVLKDSVKCSFEPTREFIWE